MTADLVRKRGILFDKDGTLFDFMATWAPMVTRFMREIARDEVHADRLGHAVGFDLQAGTFDPSSPVVVGPHNEIALRLAAAGALDGDHARVHEAMERGGAEAEPVPPTPLYPLLSELREGGWIIGCATNDLGQNARDQLRRAGVLELFDFVIGSDEAHHSKPAPDMCLAFMGEMGLEAGACIMVGDSRHDLDAGQAAGMKTVGVLTGVATRAALERHCDVVLRDISELPAQLGTLS